MVSDDDDVDDDRVVLDGEIGHWRLACPEDHQGSNVRARSDGWFCRTCRRAGDDPHFEYATDVKSGRRVKPADVAFSSPSAREVPPADHDGDD